MKLTQTLRRKFQDKDYVSEERALNQQRRSYEAANGIVHALKPVVMPSTDEHWNRPVITSWVWACDITIRIHNADFNDAVTCIACIGAL